MNERIPVRQMDDSDKASATVQIVKPSESASNQIYVRAVKGPLETFRRLFGFFFLALFAVIPWITYHGQQAVLFDLEAQRFTLFAMTLWPQDLTILAYLFIVGAFALFFVTTFAGRVWCGFMCPQTTWTYMFIWVEEKVEGPRNKRIKLDERAMDGDKFLRKSAKHALWLLIALLTSMTFVGYFTPIAPLFIDTLTLNTGFWTAFSIVFFALCTYGNAGWMREIMCTHMCPYARFQSAMFDKDTYTVAYDAKRGEGRGPRPRKWGREELAAKGLGDCIDCNLCVQVCPTGIDIRNGLQYECINCGACVDACNGVMEKMGYAKGLISYTSEVELAGGTTRIFRPKLVGYFFVLVVMTGLLVANILMRSPLELDIIRDRTSLYRETDDGLIENVYTLKVQNKSQTTHHYRIRVLGLPEYKLMGPSEVTVPGGEVLSVPVSVATDAYHLTQSVTEIAFEVKAIDNNDPVTVIVETNFLYR